MAQIDSYVRLGNSGLRVSRLCLGTMTFGEEWGWGSSQDEARAIFDAYADAGGNFIDTADLYTNGTSESWIGSFARPRRDRFVLATKYSFTFTPDPNSGGNHRKHLVRALEGSLRRLQTDYLDLYWIHAWDRITPIEETMRALDDLVRQGKILYVGISNMPAWKIAQANTLALFRSWSPFIALQIEYSLVERTPERDLLPMAQDLGLGVTPWSPLGAGILTGKYSAQGATRDPGSRLTQPGEMNELKITDRNLSIAAEVAAIAKEISRSPAQVALAWLLAQPPVTSIILGARKLPQLLDNLSSTSLSLSPDHLARLDQISKVDLGQPHDFLATQTIRSLLTGNTPIQGL